MIPSTLSFKKLICYKVKCGLNIAVAIVRLNVNLEVYQSKYLEYI